MRAKALSSAEVREVFKIDKNQILWRKQKQVSSIEGYIFKQVTNKVNRTNGYCCVKINGHMIGYHIIVWLLLKTDIPKGYMIDHIDGNKINNNINNLRLVTNRQNQQNRIIHRNGRLPGTFYRKELKKWQSYLHNEGKRFHLGYFNTQQEAYEMYLKAIQQLEG